MTKLNVNVDTDPKNKGFSVTLNGQIIPNVREFDVYQDVDKDGKVVGISVSVCARERIDDNTIKSISYHSYGSAKADEVEKSGQKIYRDLDGFVGVDNLNKISNDIMEFLKKKK